ncbi:conserved hypothetical protein [Chloroherpeton thalassium ATCC 35110]|uniref:PepSY-associated TM helix domain protein n=1 Tax=Chloroherpeton thalassium (strain ATCC 35110 / GB-78) TaxID=517418 RepID=B3QXU2_CHLT3|nr:PepSY-associated TM helix domain-containing protein [Chloroherpeton thalassium]ACF13470.1 conserved hypothetical protein [Chloroherpeton thalassium ATCC 35110]
MANSQKIKRWNNATHRDLGYFFSGLIIMYCISGLALNHIDDWNPDFVITKKDVSLARAYEKSEITNELVRQFGLLVDQPKYKIYDFPTDDQLKIYYDKASLHLNLKNGTGKYEKVSRRPVFYETNVLHRNSIEGWKWVSDIFAVMLMLITLTGLFILQGKQGLSGRGKWLLAAGFLPPLIAFVFHGMS